MKIAHVIGSCASGGAEMFVKSLLPYLKALGAELELWVMTRVSDAYPEDNVRTDFENSFVDDLEKVSIPVRFVGKRPRRDWHKTRVGLNELFRSFSPNVVHSHLESVSFHVGRSLDERPIKVQTVHSTRIEYRALHKIYLGRRFDTYIAISNSLREIIQHSLGLPKSKVSTIYNGVDLERFDVADRHFNEQVNNIVAVGRLTPAKDYPNLLNAYSLLVHLLKKEKTAIPRLSIVGDGDLRKDIESMIRSLKLQNHVELLGVRKDIPEILRRADIYVMSSEWEGLSIALIEALAAGLPIVASNAGSNNEIVENGVSGLIVPIKNPQALAKSLYDLIANREMRESFSIAAAKRAEIFSIETCAQKHMDLYRELMKDSK